MNSCGVGQARGLVDLPRRVASGRPKRMLSAIVPEKRNGSCGTRPIWRRSESLGDLAHVDAVDAAPRPALTS